MKFSRRDFIHAGCLAGAIKLSPAIAGINNPGSLGGSPFPNPLLSQRNVVNLNFLSEFNYAFINHITPADGTVGPFGSAFSATTNTWMQLIDQNGWQNNTAGGTGTFGGGIRWPASANFAGPYVVTWDGDGTFKFLTGSDVWTEASTTTTAVGNANGTTTLSGFASVIGVAPGFGISGTGVPGSTTVVSVNYLTKTIVVSAAVTTGSGITFTLTNATYTKNSNGNWTNTAGVKPYVVVSNSGFSAPTLGFYQITSTGRTPASVTSMTWSGGAVTVTTASPHARPIGSSLNLTFQGATPSTINGTFTCTMTGASTFTFPLAVNPGSITGTLTYVAFLTNLQVYRQVDEVDGAPVSQGGNGLIFRAPFKQAMVNLNPSAIRFLNWDSCNNNNICRFESRSLPGKAGSYVNWTAGPAYGKTSGTNVITLAAATGTAGNSQTTPASMVHGEVVQCLMSNAMTRAGGFSVSNITQANPGQITTSLPHGYSNGDITQLFCGTNFAAGNPYVGMTELNFVPLTVTVVDANNFTIGIDTTGFTAFTAGTKNHCSCAAYVTLQVGSGNDRTAYPIVDVKGSNTIGSNASNYAATTYMSFVFDKNIAATRPAGASLSWTMGAWVFSGQASAGNPANISGGVPIEYMTSLVVEVNQLGQSQGINKPVHMWLNMPHNGLQPVDPDYSAASDWALNAASVVMAGANGFKGLIGNTTASLLLEYSNETWNFLFSQTSYMAWLNYIRNGSATTDASTMSALRTTLMARNVNANSPYRSRVKLTLGIQGSVGYAPPNTNRLTGAGTNYFTDSWNTWQGGLTPISQHDACNPATYFDPPAAYTNTVTGTGTFTDDSAMFNGADNSGNSGGNYTGAANPTQAIANFVNKIVTTGIAGTDQTISVYCSQSNPSAGIIAQYATQMALLGKYVIQYEGATDWPNSVGSSLGTHTITGPAGSGDNAFLLGILQSQAWATAQAQFFSNCSTLLNSGPGAIYTFISISTTGPRWSYMWPDTYAGGIEGGAFTASPMWTTLGARNQGLPN